MYLYSSATFAFLAQAVLLGLSLSDASTDGGGGEAAAGGAAPADTGAAESVVTEATSGAAADSDPDGDDDGDEDVVTHLPDQQVRTRLRRQQRINKATRPIAERFREPDGRYMKPEQVDQILRNHREYTQIDSILSRSPRAVQVLIEEQDRLQRGAAAQSGDPDPADAPFNEADWPMERESPEGKRLFAMAKELHETRLESRRLAKRLDAQGTREQQRDLSTIENTWKDQTLSSVRALNQPAPIAKHLVETIRFRFNTLAAQGLAKLTAVQAKQVIDEVTAPFRAAANKTTRTAATAAAATVTRNAGLPTSVRPGAVIPATGREESGKRETIKDARAGFLAKYR